MAKYETAPSYCGGYSWNSDTSSCKVVTGADDPVVALDGSNNPTGAAGKCVAMKDASGNSPA